MRLVLASFFCIAGLLLGLRPAYAANPSIELYQAHAFNHVLEADDLLVLVRYELPTSDWRSADYLVDHTCVDEDDLDDNCWVSLRSGIALHTFYLDTWGSVPLSGVRTAPRIGHGISGLYFGAGHGLTWGDGAYQTCIEGSSSVFSPVPHSCLPLLWHSSQNLAATGEVMTPYLIQVVLSLEEVFPKPPNTFVNIDVITEEGLRFPREAFPAIMSVAPGAFFARVEQAMDDFDPSATPSDLESQMETAAQESRVWQSVRDIGGEYFGVGVGVFGSILTLGAALAVIAVVVHITHSTAVGVLMGGTIIGIGLFLDFVPMEPIWVIIAIALVLGSSLIFARMPG